MQLDRCHNYCIEEILNSKLIWNKLRGIDCITRTYLYVSRYLLTLYKHTISMLSTAVREHLLTCNYNVFNNLCTFTSSKVSLRLLLLDSVTAARISGVCGLRGKLMTHLLHGRLWKSTHARI